MTTLALAHEPRTIEQLCDLVRPVPSRVKAAPLGHDNSLGRYEDGAMPTRTLVLARVSGWLRDRVAEYVHEELQRRLLWPDDVGHRLMDELVDMAVERVHNSDRLPREAARSVVQDLLEERLAVSRHTGYWGGIHGA